MCEILPPFISCIGWGGEQNGTNTSHQDQLIKNKNSRRQKTISNQSRGGVQSKSIMNTSSGDTYDHGLQRGDHVVRWTNILVYPIQVHGIVLSAGDEIITVVDFGLTANKATQDSTKENEDGTTEHIDGNLNLDDMVNHEDRVMIQACDEHRKEQVGAKRINILTLCSTDEIKRWRKVDYGESIKKQWGWRWWKKDEANEANTNAHLKEYENRTKALSSNFAREQNNEIPNLEETSNTDTEKLGSNTIETDTNVSSESPSCQQVPTLPTLPKSDPENMVIARVRYLITNPEVLPPHHILFSNSECIAVWCKTGRWSTLQASIFLQSTAAGNLKSSFLLATGVGTATVTTTVPAGGIAGWLGFTTTSTVSLLSVQPWLIPLLAGYGLLTVGTPLILFQKAKERWEKATLDLNDSFWSNVDSDVFVEAIKSWAAIS